MYKRTSVYIHDSQRLDDDLDKAVHKIYNLTFDTQVAIFYHKKKKCFFWLEWDKFAPSDKAQWVADESGVCDLIGVYNDDSLMDMVKEDLEFAREDYGRRDSAQ